MNNLIIMLLLIGILLVAYYPQTISNLTSITHPQNKSQDSLNSTPDIILTVPKIAEWEAQVSIWKEYNLPLYQKMRDNLARLVQLYQEIVIDNNKLHNCKHQYQIAKKYRSLVLNQFHNLIYQTENHPAVIQKFNISLYQLQQLTHVLVESIVNQCHQKIKQEGYHIDNIPIADWNVPQEFNAYSHPASNGMYDNHLLY